MMDWPTALERFRTTGRTDAIERLILRGEPVPEADRQMLADVVARRVRRKGGRPPGESFDRVWRNAEIRADYRDALVKLAKDKPVSEAKRVVAKQHHVSVDTVDTVVRRIRRRKTTP